MSVFSVNNFNARSAIFTLLLIVCVNIVCCQFLYYDKKTYEGSVCTTADKRRGKCTSNCSTLTTEQRLNKNNICGFDQGVILLCCPKDLFNSSIIYTLLTDACINREESRKRRIKVAEYGYKKHWAAFDEINDIARTAQRNVSDRFYEFVDELNKESVQIGGKKMAIYSEFCERPPSPSLVSPATYFPAKPSEFPHMAALGWINYGNVTSWNCGGTYIHDQFVLTAAHCIANIGSKPDIVRIGDVDLNDDGDDVDAVDYDVEEVFLHEGFKEETYYNDIALLKVKKRAEYRKKYTPFPACVWLQKEVPVEKLILLGYGAPDFGRKHVERLYKGDLQLLDSDDCTKFYNEIQELPQGIIKSQVCAYDPSGKLDTCEGDSGGPLQYNGDFPYVAAIISFGKQCLDGTPGVYTRVFDFLDWIEKTLYENL